jgi:mannose-6-phosphate isomerase-like protein (cupin superfamily)
MKGLVIDIEDSTEENADFRRVLYTGKNLQLVLMSLKPGQDIGQETHKKHDQFFRIEKGRGTILIDGVTHKLKKGAGILVPAGAKHNLTNTGEKTMKLYTIYGPPNHIDKLVQRTKSMAEASSERFSGASTE